MPMTYMIYMKALLKDKNAHDGHSTSYFGASPWRLKPTRRFSWKMEALLMVTLHSLSSFHP